MDDITILLVEDNHGDVHLVERAFEDRDLPGRLSVVQTGEAALDWLRGRDEYSDAPRADLVLLDLNLPGTSGLDVLAEVKADPDLKRTPVLVLTGAQSDDDLNEAYEAGANACLTKPVDPGAFADSIQSLVDFWAATAALPSEFDVHDRTM